MFYLRCRKRFMAAEMKWMEHGKSGKILVDDDNAGIRSTLKILLPAYFGEVEGMKRGAFDFIVKPWDNEKLISVLTAARNKARKAQERGGAKKSWGSRAMPTWCRQKRSLPTSPRAISTPKTAGRSWSLTPSSRYRGRAWCCAGTRGPARPCAGSGSRRAGGMHICPDGQSHRGCRP